MAYECVILEKLDHIGIITLNRPLGRKKTLEMVLTEDAQEGLRVFKEKRPPVWKGK